MYVHIWFFENLYVSHFVKLTWISLMRLERIDGTPSTRRGSAGSDNFAGIDRMIFWFFLKLV